MLRRYTETGQNHYTTATLLGEHYKILLHQNGNFVLPINSSSTERNFSIALFSRVFIVARFFLVTKIAI